MKAELKKTMNIKSTPEKFSIQAFLNKPGFHSIAAISATLDIDYSFNKKFYIDGSIKISDCNKVIDIALESYNEDDLDNALFKLDQIIKSAQHMKNWLLKRTPDELGWNKENK